MYKNGMLLSLHSVKILNKTAIWGLFSLMTWFRTWIVVIILQWSAFDHLSNHKQSNDSNEKTVTLFILRLYSNPCYTSPSHYCRPRHRKELNQIPSSIYSRVCWEQGDDEASRYTEGGKEHLIPKEWDSPQGAICSALLRYAPSFSPPPLCLTFLALLPFILLPGNANCCLFTGWLATWMDCVYTSFKCGSTSIVSWLRMCICVCGGQKGRGVFFGKGKMPENQPDSRHGFNPHLANSFTICFQAETFKAPYYSDFSNWKLRIKKKKNPNKSSNPSPF